MKSLHYAIAVAATAAGLSLSACDSDSGTSVNDDDVVVSSSASKQSQSSSSSGKASSSSGEIKTAWDYLNPDIGYGEFTDERDGQKYKTVKIGDQTWMAQNLNYDYNKGSAKSYCLKNSEDSCAKYGRLYLWSAAMDSAAVFSDAGKGCGYKETCNSSGTVRGVCPENWHLPNREEWRTLFTAIGDSSVAGTALKTQTDWYVEDGVSAGTDAYGFSALPAGAGSDDGNVSDVGGLASFWSSDEKDYFYAYLMSLSAFVEHVYLGEFAKPSAYSVRCVKDSK